MSAATVASDSAGISGPPADLAAVARDQRYELLALRLLDAHPNNPRREVGDVTDLAASIRSSGLLEPIVVAPAKRGRFTIVAGHRRRAAALLAGLVDVPCIVRDDLVGDDGRLAMLVENLQRSDLDALEEASGFAGLVDLGLTQREIAERVGCSQSHVSKRLTLVALPPKAQKAIADGAITVVDGLELAKLPDAPRIHSVLAQHKREQWQSIDRLVAHSLEAIKRDEWIAATTKDLAAKGITVVDREDLGGDIYTHRVQKNAGTWGVDMDPKKHATLACHVVVLDGYQQQVTPCCRTPKSHRPKGTAAAPANAEAAERRARKETKAAAELRLPMLRQLVYGGLPAAARLKLQQSVLLDYATGGIYVDAKNIAKIALTILEVDFDPKSYQLPKQVRERASSGAGDTWSVAVAIATHEARLLVTHSRWGDSTRAYFELLEAHGYHPSEAEQRRLGRVLSSAGVWTWPDGDRPSDDQDDEAAL